LVRIAVTLAALAYLAATIDFVALLRAFAAVPALVWAEAVVLYLLAVGLGARRWSILLRAFGATNIPPLGFLFRTYLVGTFYNTCLPGAVGGDLVRGIVSRLAFADGKAASGLATVFVERLMGMTALLLLASSATLWHPLGGVAHLPWLAGLALAAVGATLVFLASARRLARVLPGPLGRLVAQIPTPERYAPLVPVILLSLAIQACVALGGHLLVHAMSPSVSLVQSLAIIPLAAASAFLPFTLSGLGVREAAFVVLYGAVGVPKSIAVAGSLAMFSCHVSVALLGGVLTLFGPIDLPSPGSSTLASPPS
jgi:uncharacterized membrane protein YbhN (UPF0104 family)